MFAGRLFDDAADSARVKTGAERGDGVMKGPEMDDAVGSASNARIVIMNPPFTSRADMGEKFHHKAQDALRQRADHLVDMVVMADPGLDGVLDKNSVAPAFAALGERSLTGDPGAVLAMISPTVLAANASGLAERAWLAQRLHLHTVVTNFATRDGNLSQNTEINESIFIFQRADGPRPPTRLIALDRFPADEHDAAILHSCLRDTKTGILPDGWGEVAHWPAERVAAGDWTGAVWRSPALAEAAARFAESGALRPVSASGLSAWATGRMLRGAFRPSKHPESQTAIPILKSKGADAQMHIEAAPDERWEPKHSGRGQTDAMLAKAGHLLVTAGQGTITGRLTAVASTETFVGNGWIPVTGLTADEAKAVAVFLNSTPGRLLLMCNLGQKLRFPSYMAATVEALPVPDLADSRSQATLTACWEATRGEVVPQFRDGYTDIRRRWDTAVCKALGWDIDEIAELGELLAREPRVRGVAYGQWKP